MVVVTVIELHFENTEFMRNVVQRQGLHDIKFGYMKRLGGVRPEFHTIHSSETFEEKKEIKIMKNNVFHVMLSYFKYSIKFR